MKNSFRILHLSDLHFKESSMDPSIVIEAFFEDIKKLKDIDVVIFTGDLVLSGALDNFNKAKSYFIDRCIKLLNIDKERFLLTLGNHDVNRSRIKDNEFERSGLDLLKTKHAINDYIDNYLNSDRFNRIDDFNNFLDSNPNSSEVTKHRLFRNYILKNKTKTIGISCLNSAWASYGGIEDYGKLIIGERQIDLALEQVKDCDLKIAAFHHPERWLNPIDNSFLLIKSNYDLILFGHNHEAIPESNILLGHNCITSNGGCLYENRNRHNSFSIIDYNFETYTTSFNYRTYFDKRRVFDEGVDIISKGSIAFQRERGHFNFLSEIKNAIKIAEDIDDYLNMLVEMIDSSKEEFLYTSTKMSDTLDEVYGNNQQKIIESSLSFKNRCIDRIHLGIIDSRPDTLSGSFELRNQIKDIVLRFNPELSTIGFNFIISDSKKVIIRLQDRHKYGYFAVLIENEYFAQLLRKHFFSLWKRSLNMYEFASNIFINSPFTKSKIIQNHFKNRNNHFSNFMENVKEYDEIYSDLDYNSSIKVHTNKTIPFIIDKHDEFTFTKFTENIVDHISKTPTNNADIYQIRSFIKKALQIDYDKKGYVFNYIYFIANYFKLKHTFFDISSFLKNRSILNILDLGGGGGSSLSATVNYFISNYPAHKIDFTVVDRSPFQIQFAKSLVNESNANIDIKYSNCDVYEFLSKSKLCFDMVIASNIFCETLDLSNPNSLLSLIIDRLNENGIMIVIERVESHIYDTILEKTPLKLLKYKYKNERYEIPLNEINPISLLISNDFQHISNKMKRTYTLRYGIYGK